MVLYFFRLKSACQFSSGTYKIWLHTLTLRSTNQLEWQIATLMTKLWKSSVLWTFWNQLVLKELFKKKQKNILFLIQLQMLIWRLVFVIIINTFSLNTCYIVQWLEYFYISSDQCGPSDWSILSLPFTDFVKNHVLLSP